MSENIKCPRCGSEHVWHHPWQVPYNCYDCQCHWDESKRQPLNAWIPCSERMPENQQEVIFYVAGKRYPFVTCGKYQHDRWIDLDGAYLDETQARACNIPIHDRVTLWQPLPQLPKTESEA